MKSPRSLGSSRIGPALALIGLIAAVVAAAPRKTVTDRASGQTLQRIDTAAFGAFDAPRAR